MKMLGRINFENKIYVPENLFLVQKKAVLHDDLPVIWYRFAKSQSTQLGGEHFSFTYDENNKKLMGFMHMDKMYTEDVLPNEQEAQEIADAFLSQYAPDLKKSVEVRWIKPQRVNPIDPPHDEGFPLHNAGTVVGMRVKMWDTLTKKYAWVIVGKNKDIISFERDIIWNSLLHKRQTAQWLHNAWLKKNKVSLEPDGIICWHALNSLLGLLQGNNSMYHLIYTKFLIVLGYTIWLSIAAFNNIKDYGTNQFLIRKMVSMMPLEKRKHTGQGLLYRKCCNPKIKQLLFEHYHWCATDNFSVIMALCIIDNNKIIPSYASFQSFDPANCHNGFDCSHGAVACIFVWWTLVWLLVAYGRDAAHPYVAAHYNAIDNYFN